MPPTISTFVFDVYGTLFDVHSVKEKADELFDGKGTEISEIWRRKQLEYSFLRQLMGNYETFFEVTKDSLKYALKQLAIPFSNKEVESLMVQYTSLRAYDEVQNVLSTLKENGRVLAVFSNGSRNMLEPLVEQAGMKEYFHHIISVDDTKQYKPTPASYTGVLKVIGVKREEVLFMSSNGWDISGAKNFGFHTAWINRNHLPQEELGLAPDYTFDSLDGILDLL
ncbi:haloacid dehalogenase, type II [Sutcliffiella horikoshii]|uniref:Haloacid dehalogenase type II n=1 Tax=Sutcliffiella horikoshii TaxID=79883 RepID=A0A1Y0CHF1_9BACI|nr:haloacid dehalogenase type II [Sutcliffiella horikoshii]ART74738.1 haloacid dehalogenase, type II [Sutcliffiella horikoshii]TYS57348.1 haloacid dehalogenase type II [Sutcliffiella horikoshii]